MSDARCSRCEWIFLRNTAIYNANSCQSLTAIILKCLYKISPLHPLAKYPGPLLWRLSRLPASYHHARGDLYQRISAIHYQHGPKVRIAPDELSFTSPDCWGQIYNSRPQLQKTTFHFADERDPDGFAQTMITANDAEHMRLRRLASPAFLSSGVLEVEPVMQQYTELLCSQLADASGEGSQNMVEWLLWTLNDVIGHLAMDQRFECLARRRMHPWPSFLLAGLKLTAGVNQFRRFGISPKWLQLLLTREMRDLKYDFVGLRCALQLWSNPCIMLQCELISYHLPNRSNLQRQPSTSVSQGTEEAKMASPTSSG